MRRVGIEIENESFAVSFRGVSSFCEASPNWVCERDGSLRGGPMGWEIKTAGSGLPLDRALASLNELYPVLRSSSGVWRAAVHCHVDARDLTDRQKALALGLCYTLDQQLFEATNPERKESNFCVPMSHKAHSVRAAFKQLLARGVSRGYGKYSSVNFSSLASFGTVEFRHMRTPACDDSIDSISSALQGISNFVRASHDIIQLVGVMRDRAELIPVFERIVGMAENFTPYRITPDPICVMEVIDWLRSEPVDITTTDLGVLRAEDEVDSPPPPQEDLDAESMERVERTLAELRRRAQRRRDEATVQIELGSGHVLPEWNVIHVDRATEEGDE
jgi:hypothetical protein